MNDVQKPDRISRYSANFQFPTFIGAVKPDAFAPRFSLARSGMSIRKFNSTQPPVITPISVQVIFLPEIASMAKMPKTMIKKRPLPSTSTIPESTCLIERFCPLAASVVGSL